MTASLLATAAAMVGLAGGFFCAVGRDETTQTVGMVAACVSLGFVVGVMALGAL